MSAFIVSNAHIDALVLAGVQYRIIEPTPGDMAELGQMLWAENHRSVNHRYDENEPTPSYRDPAHLWQRRLQPATVANAVHCYEYQSCDHPGWERSAARRFCVALKDALLAAMPGYDDAPWGIDDLHAITEPGPTVLTGRPPLGVTSILR